MPYVDSKFPQIITESFPLLKNLHVAFSDSNINEKRRERMADLMTGKFEYKQLADKYANFIVPTVRIKVNGLDVIKMKGFIVSELDMRLAVEEASSVRMKFAHAYDIQSHSFSSEIKDTFQLGSIVEVELGYLSTTEHLFKGYVEMLGVEMGKEDLFVVTLMDAKRLMMNSGKKNILYTEKNYSDVFKKIMGNYANVCSVSIDTTNDNLENPISQMSNDYDFVMTELIGRGKVNREFIILAGKAYFQKPKKVTTPIIKMRYGRELIDLSVSHCYKDLMVQVIGVDDKQNVISGQAEAKGELSQKKVMSQTPIFMIADPHADTKDKAATKAEAVARQEKEKSCIGRGSTIGIPEIVPGRYLEIENMDSMLDKKYYITEVMHHYTRESYTTHFEIGGCV